MTLLSLMALLAFPEPAVAGDHAVSFTSTPAVGLGPEPGVMRRDPSDIIAVEGTFYVWYTKGNRADGYDATVW